MPGKETVFRPSSILVRPRRNAPSRFSRPAGRALVEAPGTAPGSERCITPLVYRHSRPCGRRGEYRRGNGWMEGADGVGLDDCSAVASLPANGCDRDVRSGSGAGHSRRAPGRGARECDPESLGARGVLQSRDRPLPAPWRGGRDRERRGVGDQIACRGGGAAIWPSGEVGQARLGGAAVAGSSDRGIAAPARTSALSFVQLWLRFVSQRSARRSSRSTGSTEAGR
jgi:hypothetical protein